MSDPTIAELVRRLDETTKSLEHLARTLEQSYVRREVYEARHDALRAEGKAIESWAKREIDDVRADVTRIENDRATDKQFRRQITAAVASGFVLLVLNLLMAASNFMSRVGH